jgi:hypothetical protein
MKYRLPTIVILGCLLGLFVIATTGKAADDPNSGTWKMNPAKSKYDPGPAPKETITKIEVDENHYKVDAHTVNADGTELRITFDAKTDGKDYPLAGTPTADMVSVKRVNATTIETTWKKEGKIVMNTHGVVSSDGKTRTVTFSGTDAQGHKVHNVVVYEKGM